MEGIKLSVFLISCLLLEITLSSPIPATNEEIQKLEERVEELTEKLKLLNEESLHHTKRQAATTNTILNENRKLRFSVAIASYS